MAGTAVLNGAGELTGSLQIREWGLFETPVYLTATMSVGRVYDGAVALAAAIDPDVGLEAVVIPVVGECDDSWLNDARTVQVEAADAARAVEAAGPDFAQGAVGAGTGMVCFGAKGGIGSASRVAGDVHGRRAGAGELRRRPGPARGRRARRAAARAHPGRAPAAGGKLHRGCGHRRRARLGNARAPGAPRGPRPGAHRLGGPPRQR